jgi:hypothetical protein
MLDQYPRFTPTHVGKTKTAPPRRGHLRSSGTSTPFSRIMATSRRRHSSRTSGGQWARASGQPSPFSPTDGTKNGSLADSKPFAQETSRDAALGINQPNLSNLFCRERSRAVSLSSKPSSTSLRHHVAAVVGCASQIKVLRVNARSVVAEVQDHHSIWDGPVSQLVGYSMGAGRRRATSWVELAVASMIDATLPKPASCITFCHFAPKPVLSRFGTFPSHLLLLLASSIRKSSIV